MKTAKEILRKHYPKHLTIVEEENTLKAMEEYADQFKPKEPEVKKNKTNWQREILTMQIMTLRDRNMREEMIIDEAIKESIKLIETYESEQ